MKGSPQYLVGGEERTVSQRRERGSIIRGRSKGSWAGK